MIAESCRNNNQIEHYFIITDEVDFYGKPLFQKSEYFLYTSESISSVKSLSHDLLSQYK